MLIPLRPAGRPAPALESRRRRKELEPQRRHEERRADKRRAAEIRSSVTCRPGKAAAQGRNGTESNTGHPENLKCQNSRALVPMKRRHPATRAAGGFGLRINPGNDYESSAAVILMLRVDISRAEAEPRHALATFDLPDS